MSPLSLIPILPIVGLALLTTHLISKVVHVRVTEGHYASIDGMRGYLAFFVFLHHSSIWYLNLKYRHWGLPPSNLYSHFGPTSVAMFFMITAFLFFRKLLNAGTKGFDWPKLYIGRAFRILPLYWSVVLILFVIVFILSGFRLFLPPEKVVVQMLGWMIFMSPDMNGIGGTGLIIAGITGSLAFEWLFYFMLAFLGRYLFKVKTSIVILFSTGILFLLFVFIIENYYPHLAILRVLWFSGGIIAALAIKSEQVRELAASRECSFFIVFLLAVAVYFFPTIDSVIPLICVILAFVAIACGNTLFGLLSRRISRKLGQISYSIFMLHGFLLFITFRFLIGPVTASKISPTEFWGIIAVIGIILVCLSVLSYTYIELPMIKAAPRVSAKIEFSLRRCKEGIVVSRGK